MRELFKPFKHMGEKKIVLGLEFLVVDVMLGVGFAFFDEVIS